MEKIRFITDSASDMNHPREDVTILPLHIRFGDDEYADGVTISHREFYEKLSNVTLSPPPAWYLLLSLKTLMSRQSPRVRPSS